MGFSNGTETLLLEGSETELSFSPILTLILIPTLVLNFGACLIFTMLLAKLAFETGPLLKNPLNAMIIVDENIKLMALLGQSVMAFYFVHGVRVHKVRSETRKLKLYTWGNSPHGLVNNHF